VTTQATDHPAGELVHYVVKHLVRSPEDIAIRVEDKGAQDVVYLTVAGPDVGRVIGRQGRTVNAMRTLLATLEQTSHGRGATLEVLDPED
jgi:uncharacterized protein